MQQTRCKSPKIPVQQPATNQNKHWIRDNCPWKGLYSGLFHSWYNSTTKWNLGYSQIVQS